MTRSKTDKEAIRGILQPGSGAWMVRGLFGANAAKSRGSALYAQKENGRPRVGTCPESAMVHGNLGLYEADEIRISHSNARALSLSVK